MPRLWPSSNGSDRARERERRAAHRTDRRLGSDDPPDCPAGWRTGPPDFVGVGAQKAGTTWWFRLIEAHPAVQAIEGQRPEVHFFDRFVDGWPSQDEITRYQRFFPRPPGALAGEKTPNYMACHWVPPMLREAAPDARLICILRDPIARYVSGRTHDDHRGGAPAADPRDRREASGGRDAAGRRHAADEISWVGDAFAKGLYAQQLGWLLAAFPRAQVLVLQFERCVQDPAAELARTYDFLGLAAHPVPSDELTRPRNVTRTDKIDLDARRKALLVELYAPDVRALATMVPDLDLSLWPDFDT